MELSNMERTFCFCIASTMNEMLFLHCDRHRFTILIVYLFFSLRVYGGIFSYEIVGKIRISPGKSVSITHNKHEAMNKQARNPKMVKLLPLGCANDRLDSCR
jgi:hypothetical protein